MMDCRLSDCRLVIDGLNDCRLADCRLGDWQNTSNNLKSKINKSTINNCQGESE